MIRRKENGYSLIQFIIVTVIIAVVGTVIFVFIANRTEPEFHADKTLENLAILRKAQVEYIHANKGKYPGPALAELVKSGSLKEIPAEGHKNSNKVVNKFDGTGGWYYNTKTHEIFPNFSIKVK